MVFKLKKMKTSTLLLAAIMVLLAGTGNLEAQPGNAYGRKAKNYPSHKAAGLHDNRLKPNSYFNNKNKMKIKFHGHDYMYLQGLYYRRHNTEYLQVAPPFGIRVGYIPAGCVTIRVMGAPYFYFDGVFYRHNTRGRYYEVVAPPSGAIVTVLPGFGVRTLFIEGMKVLEYNNILYRPFRTQFGINYKVIGTLGNDLYAYNY